MNTFGRDVDDGRISGGESRTQVSALMGVGEVAALLGISTRQVYRLSDTAKMPRPFKLGGLTRWSRSAIHEWIDNDCPEIGGGQ